MNEKNARQIRKEVNSLRRKEREISDNLVRELFNAPFKYRFLFALRLVFYRRKK